MVRKKLLAAVSEKAGCTKVMAGRVMDAYADVVADVLKNDRSEYIEFGTLGSFQVKHVKERAGVTNLYVTRAYTKPAHDKLIFKLGKYGSVLFDDDNDESEGED